MTSRIVETKRLLAEVVRDNMQLLLKEKSIAFNARQHAKNALHKGGRLS